ncbi:hypothetical protein BU17DRAFT_54356 [Hysterangium stoloniferum]|nr:hypothetical protein BU17DRAFT_54356 [Hysterangium stoloniferum]
MPRPNVAPRPPCRYFTTPRGCHAGNKCHYLHADPTYAPYEENKTCRFFERGYCKRGSECWFKHVEPEGVENAEVHKPLDEEDVACGICFDDKPALYGLLIGCSHAFCLTCIRQWRDPDGKGTDLTDSGIHKTCPMCRLQTKFIVPSSIFYAQGDPRKLAAVEMYRLSMARVPCRYFVNSPPDERYCPFGKDCFYQHKNADGTPFVFMDGVDVMMTVCSLLPF